MLAIFLDIETTGLDPYRHTAIDVALKVIDLTLEKEVAKYQSLVKISSDEWGKRDPVSIEINGYRFEELLEGKSIQIIQDEIVALFTSLKVARGKAVFICQNPAFDRAFFAQIVDVYTQERLNWPYHWLDFASMYWALLTKELKNEKKEFPRELNLSKNEIAKKFSLKPESTPHKAINGVDHLMACYQALLS